MFVNKMSYGGQSMHMVHRSRQGSQIWLGDYYAASNVALLKQKQIKSVLTAAAMLGITYDPSHQINHKIISAFDMPSYKMTPHFEDAFNFMDKALSKGNMLVHCAAGISRSTTFVIVYLMRAQGMSFKKALDYIRMKRTFVCPNDGFQRELKRYELTVEKMPPKKQGQVKKEIDNQKKAVLQFIKQDQQPKGTKQMRSTLGNAQLLMNKTPTTDYRGIMRGKSLVYSKPTPTYQSNKNQINNLSQTDTKQRGNSIKPLKNTFLTYKLQSPKIVTIKK